jgi:hypothetical protein
MIDLVFTEIELPAGDGDWNTACGSERSRPGRPYRAIVGRSG